MSRTTSFLQKSFETIEIQLPAWFHWAGGSEYPPRFEVPMNPGDQAVFFLRNSALSGCPAANPGTFAVRADPPFEQDMFPIHDGRVDTIQSGGEAEGHTGVMQPESNLVLKRGCLVVSGALRPGSYVVISNMPGDYEHGMRFAFSVN